MEEIWKNIEWYQSYLVSNLGDIKSLKSWINLKFTESKSWHLSILLYNNNWKKRFSVHRIVANHYIEKIDWYDIVMHIVSNPKNNRADNLKWWTRSQNAKQAYSEWAIKPMVWMKWKYWKLHHKSKAVVQKSLDWIFMREWESVRQIQREIWFSQANVSKCCLWSYKQAYGFIWEYLTI